MKLYMYDMGWQGSLSVVAESREQATELAERQESCQVRPCEWIEYDFKEVVRTWGDQ